MRLAYVLVGGLAATATLVLLLAHGPTMRRQASLRTFEAAPVPLPPGVVPVEAAPRLPSEAQADGLAMPEGDADLLRAHGRTFYGWWCAHCHGEDGRGDGPVGRSFVPRPADLKASALGGRSDGNLLRAMLTGTGHEPVLERVVPQGHRAPLVRYLRALGEAEEGPR